MNENLTAFVGAKISEFRRKMAEVNRITKRTATTAIKPIDANIKKFKAKMLAVDQSLKRHTKDFVINIEADIADFTRKMDRVATTIRTLGTIATNTFSGIGIAISQATVPVIASLAQAIGNLGPILGVIGGSALGLGTSFGAASIGAAAFGSIAVSNLKDVFGVQEDVQKLQEKLAVTDDADERAGIMKEMQTVLGTLNKEQMRAYDANKKVGKTWGDITKSLEPQTVDVYTKAVDSLNTILGYLKPTFTAATNAVNNLMDQFKGFLQLDDVKGFFDWLGDFAGPAMEAWGQIGMNVMRGVMNLMVAFGPLAEKMQDGLVNLTDRFANWSSTLAGSSGMQKFIDYITTNGPKLLSFIGDMTTGFVNLFTAFGGSSSDMMTGLQNIASGFRDWTESLGSNNGFQKFMDYASKNGPVVMSVLGGIASLVMNVLEGMMPLGEFMLTMVDRFLSWTNSMMDAYPIIGYVLSGVTALAGILTALIPNIIAVTVIKKTFGKTLGDVAKKITEKFLPVLGNIGKFIVERVIPFVGNVISWVARLGTSLLTNGARMAAGWLIGMGPIGWITAAVIALVALIIWKWDEIKAFTIQIWSSVSQWLSTLWTTIITNAATLLAPLITALSTIFTNTVNAGKTIFTTFMTTLSTIWTNIKTIASSMWTIIKNVILGPILLLIDLATGDFEGFASHLGQIWNNIKTAGQEIWNSLKNIVVALISGLVTSATTWITTLAANLLTLWSGIQATASRIWNSLVSTVSSIVSGLVDSVVSFFADLVSGVAEKMNEAYDTVVDLWNDAQSFLEDIDLMQIGKDIISGLISGIGSMASSVWDKVKEVAGGIKSSIESALIIHSPSRWMRDQIGKNIGAGMIIGMDAMQSKVNAASTKLAQAAMVEPQRTSLAFDTSLSSSDFGRVQHDFGAQMDDFELPENNSEIILELDGRQIARATVGDISRLQDKKVRSNAVYR
jgi:phage-related protein